VGVVALSRLCASALRARRWSITLALALLTLVGCLAVGAVGVSRAHLETPPGTVLLLDRHGRFLGEIGGDGVGFGYWELERTPPRVAAAMVAIEDRRFWSHPGVDLRAVGRAAWQNLRHGRHVSGASTLAMQIARMQAPGRRTYLRKACEACTALALTRRHPRDELMRHYLRIVPYGNRIHGIGYAARRYLDKPVADLSWAEVAFLAAIPQSPARMNPHTSSGRRRAIARGERILDLLRELGELDAVDHQLARRQIASIRVPSRARRPRQAMHALVAFEHGRHDIAPGVVRTTIDLDLQQSAAGEVERAVRELAPRGAGNAAAMVLALPSREVLAHVGSGDYFDTARSGAIDYTRVPRSPGSTLKPFLYALALERGLIDPDSVLDDVARGAGEVGNADERFLGPLLPRAALANSRNVPAVDLLQELGVAEGASFLADLGLHDGDVPARRMGLGLAIGGVPTSLERLVRAYTALADGGRLGELEWRLDRTRAPTVALLSEDTARQITLFLSDPMARLPSFPRMGQLEYPFPVAVKTGTSSGYHDAWTVAYSARYLVAAWVGHPDYLAMNRLTGYNSAARLVRRILLQLHPEDDDGLEDVGFPPPRGHTPVRLCALTGLRATRACPQVAVEHLRPGREPVNRCRSHQVLAVDARDGRPASHDTPAEHRMRRTYTDLGPRYAAWQVAQGLPFPPLATAPARDRGAAMQPAELHIISPRRGLRLMRDPETPADRSTIALSVTVDPPRQQVVWYVDGAPYRVADHPFTVRWRLSPGTHTFQARLPYEPGASQLVHVTVD
jgi:penicillin-binding protein 1C